MVKRLLYADKEVKEYEMGGKIVLIRQETQAKEAAFQNNKVVCKNEQYMIIIVKKCGKWCA